jgi:hypothetical protein
MRHAPFRRLGLYAWPAQILLYLHPLDLLRIYRTCSSLRDVIISPATRFLWDASFSSVPNMPPCPSHLTHMFYAHLSFEHRCHVRAFLPSAYPALTRLVLRHARHDRRLEALDAYLRPVRRYGGHSVRSSFPSAEAELTPHYSHPVVDISLSMHPQEEEEEVYEWLGRCTAEDLVSHESRLGVESAHPVGIRSYTQLMHDRLLDAVRSLGRYRTRRAGA